MVLLQILRHSPQGNEQISFIEGWNLEGGILNDFFFYYYKEKI